jgi:hypothetical protein
MALLGLFQAGFEVIDGSVWCLGVNGSGDYKRENGKRKQMTAHGRPSLG